MDEEEGQGNLEPGPSALRWLLGDDDADRAWGRVKITSQLIGYFEGKAVLPRIYFRTAGGHRAVAKLSLSRAGLKFKSFRQIWRKLLNFKPARNRRVMSTRATRAPRKHSYSFSAATQTCKKKRQEIDGVNVDGESLKISRDRPVFIANRSAEEKLCTLYTCILCWPLDPAGIFSKRSVRSTRTDKGDSKAPSHAVRNHLFASCAVQALPFLHLHSRTCFWQDNCQCSNRKLASFGIILSNPYEAALCFLFVCSYLRRIEKKRKKFDLTTAVWFDLTHVRASAWPGEPTVSLLPLYVQCAIRSCLIFDSLRHYSRSSDIHCLFRASFPRSAVVLVFVEQPAKSCFSIARQ